MKRFFIVCCLICFTQASFGQYNIQRESLFEELPITPKDIVFLGNSITDGGEWCELFDSKHVKNRGISGDRAEFLLNRLTPITSGQPKKVFLLIGINDLAAGHKSEKVIADIEQIVLRIRTQSPRTKVYVQSILPVNNSFPNFAERHGSKGCEIREINAALQKFCAGQQRVIFIDLHPAMSDGEGRMKKEYTNDGLHLLGKGYIAWRDCLRKYVR